MTDTLEVQEPDREWSTDALGGLLRARCPAPEWALFFEVRNATGFPRQARTADAVGMNTWVSRGLEVHGFEIKKDRGDWRRELRDPAKADEIARFCDRWWVVAAPKVVKPEELPPTWGLLVPRGRALVAVKEAPKLAPVPMTRAFTAALLRVAIESSASESQIRAAVAAADRAWSEQRAKERARESEHQGQRVADLERVIATFEEASGVRIRSWESGRVGEAVRLVLSGQDKQPRRELERIAEYARKLADETAAVLAELKEPAAAGEEKQ